MSATPSHSNSATLDLARWRNLPNWLLLGGGLLAVIGAFVNYRQFAYSWLLAFMLFLGLTLGALFLVLVHHLFDAGWSTPLRRFLEHLSCLAFPWMALLFLPILLNVIFANDQNILFPWMAVDDPHSDHALHAKLPLFTKPMFYVIVALCFLVWGGLSRALRGNSLAQDQSGAARLTYRMRFHAAWGIFAFAITLTLAAIMWMKALQHQWFSTIYGVYYFAGSVWMTIATAYVIAAVLGRTGHLKPVLFENQFYFLGSLFLAFTVFYAYIHFSQYFIIWNANIPEETFWYQLRERGSWYGIGLVIIFGHFFLPFLALLRIDAKLTLWWMLPLCGWAWLMRFVDLSFNIMPVLHPDGFVLHWMDLACLALMGGLLAKMFVKSFAAHPPYPLRDPRIREARGFYHPVGEPVKPHA